MKYTLIILFIANFVYAADCPDCAKISALEAKMAKVKPDSMNFANSEKQVKIAEQADDLIKANLNNKRFTPESAAAIVMLIWHAIPYDNAGYLLEYHQAAFKKMYFEPNSLLHKTIDDLGAKNFLSQGERKSLLNDFGIRAD